MYCINVDGGRFVTTLLPEFSGEELQHMYLYNTKISCCFFKLYGPDVMYVNFPKNTPVLNLSLPVVFLDACMGNLF